MPFKEYTNVKNEIERNIKIMIASTLKHMMVVYFSMSRRKNSKKYENLAKQMYWEVYGDEPQGIEYSGFISSLGDIYLKKKDPESL